MTNDVRPAESIEILGVGVHLARGAPEALDGHDVPVDKVGYVQLPAGPAGNRAQRRARRGSPC